MSDPAAVRLSVFLEADNSGELDYLRQSMPLSMPMHDARLLVLRLIELIQRAQEDAEIHVRPSPEVERKETP